MALLGGFFNSVNGDRKYSAEQMNYPYRRIVSNGVFARPNGQKSDDFQVQAVSGLNIVVKAGEGIFAGKWAVLDADFALTIPIPSVNNPRIDSVIMKVDVSMDERKMSIVYRNGTESDSPVHPDLVRNGNVTEYRLGDIYVRANASGITQADITDTRPSEDCGFVTHLLQQADISQTYAQWGAQFHEWFESIKNKIASATSIVSYRSEYTNQTPDAETIPISIPEYDPTTDILNVYINGMRLVYGSEYTLPAGQNSNIVLTYPITAGTPVSFEVLKPADANNTLQSLLDRISELEQRVEQLGG